MVTLEPHPWILWHLGYRAAYNYMVEKKQYISPAGFSLINFLALSTTLKATSPLYWLWFSKFVLGHSASGCMMHLWGNGTVPSAPAVDMIQKLLNMYLSVPIPTCILNTDSKYFSWSNGCPQWILYQKSSSASSKVSIWNNLPCFPHFPAPQHRQWPRHKITLVGLTFSSGS